MTFDYRAMTEEIVKSGRPAERSYPLDSGSNTPNTVSGMTIDTTARPAPNTLDYLPRRCWAQPMPVLARFRRSQFEHFIEKWSFPKPQVIKGGIVLTADDSFSPVLEKLLGPMNTTNIYGLDDEQIKTSVFEALVEREATNQYRSDNGYYVKGLLNIDDESRDGMIIHGKLESDSSLHWRINYRTECKGGWLDLVRTAFNLSRLDALMTLAKIVNMNIENLQLLSSNRYSIEWNGSLCIDEDVPNVLHLSRFPAGSGCAELVGKAYIYGNAGQVIGAILRYRLDKKDFCLPATVSNQGELSMGKYKPTAHFLNQHLMDAHPHAVIVFCQDMRTALALQRTLEETRGYNPAEIIVTAHLGEDLSVLPWSYLYGHDVVFACAPTKKCMIMVKAYETYVRGAMAKSFRVHLGFLLHSAPKCGLQGDVVGVTDTEAELLHGAVWIDTVERPTWQIVQMVKNAVSYEEYLAWGRNLGIFKIPKGHEHDVVPSSDGLVLFNANAEEVATQPSSIEDVTVKHIFPFERNVLLHGLKDAGKSFISLAVAKAVTCGKALFGSFPSDGGSNAMYINSETPKEDFTQRLSQFGIVKMVGKQLLVLSKYDHTATDCAFSLADTNFRDKVTALLQKHEYRYLILDNLTSLMDDGQSTQAIAVSKVYAWIEKLQQCGVCVILVHHTKDDSKAGTGSAKVRGSQDSSIRGHTEIVLISSTQILEQKLGPENVQLAAAQDGLTVGVLFKVCKSACVLQKKTIWLHLPLGAAEWQLMAVTDALGKLVEQQPDAEGSKGVAVPDPTDGRAASPAPTSLTALHPDGEAGCMTHGPDTLDVCTADEVAVYKLIKKRGSIKNSDVQALLECESTKAGGILSRLTANRLIKREGGGPATHYLLA